MFSVIQAEYEDSLPAARSNDFDRTAKRPDLGAGATSFFDEKYDSALGPLRGLEPVAGFADEIGNVDGGERIGATDLQEIAWPQQFQRFTRFQGWQGTIQSHQVKLCDRHAGDDGAGDLRRQPARRL